ncbi:MAG: DUF3515 family protein [Nocardioidaceae bacterium]
MAGALMCAAVLSGCATSPVEVAGPVQGPAECRRLLDGLPDMVAGQARRKVSPRDALAAAWGDPAIVLRCAVPEPAALRPSSPCAEVDQVGWLAERQQGSYRFSTIGRSTVVQMQVPYDYEPAADALVDVAAAIRHAVPELEPCV